MFPCKRPHSCWAKVPKFAWLIFFLGLWWDLTMSLASKFLGCSTMLVFEYPIGCMYGIFTYIYHKHQSNVGKYTYYTWILWVWFFWHIFRIGILLGDVLIGPMPSDDRCWGCSTNKDGRPTSTSTTSMCGGWIWQVPKEIPINLLQCNILFQKNVSPLSWYYRCSVQKCGGVSNDISDSFDMNFILLMLQKSSTTWDRKGWC